MQTILSKIKSIFRRQDRDGLTVFGRSQHFDWEALLCIFLVLTFVVVLINTHVFLGVRKGDIFRVEKTVDAPVKTIDRKKMSEVLTQYEERAKKLLDLKINRPTFVDPSL